MKYACWRSTATEEVRPKTVAGAKRPRAVSPGPKPVSSLANMIKVKQEVAEAREQLVLECGPRCSSVAHSAGPRAECVTGDCP